MIKEQILNNWGTDIIGYAQIIPDLADTEFPAWTIKFNDSYGVAIPYNGDEEINEKFSNAKIRSSVIQTSSAKNIRTLLLLSDTEEIKIPFSTLCEALVDPGENGKQRRSVENSPVSWWKEWKELLGNRDIDERVYDVLGELCVLLYAVKKGEDAKWNGPNGASYDIETDKRFIEAKSSISRDKKEITISNQFQLFPVEKPLELIFCAFEPVIMSGISIDQILSGFDEIGYNTNLLNDKLESLGFEKGMSIRKKQFILHEMLEYKIDDTFPRITPESFVEGVMPAGITKINYTVDLSGLQSVSLLQGETDDL